MNEKSKGLHFEDDKIEVFFGNRNFTLHELTSLKPTGVHSLRQTHSDILHIVEHDEPPHPLPEGDALCTALKKQILVVKTGDCLPVMIHDSELNRIAAVHAGWKGVANKIVPKTIEKYFSKSKHLQIFVGPHITKNSFQIKDDVLALLKNTLPLDQWKKINVEEKSNCFYVSLVEIVKLQISTQFANTIVSFKNTNIDTKTDQNYNSHRRDPQNSSRNISYIKLK